MRHRGALAHGVIYDPNRNELFTASKGGGAFLNDRRIRVSKCLRLGDALVGTGFPFREVDAHRRSTRSQLKNMMQKCAGVRRAGAAALDLAYVACGRLDAFWELGLSPWDMAAGALLIQEAGGLVGDVQGEDGFMESGEIACATPKIFPAARSAARVRLAGARLALLSPRLLPRLRQMLRRPVAQRRADRRGGEPCRELRMRLAAGNYASSTARTGHSPRRDDGKAATPHAAAS